MTSDVLEWLLKMAERELYWESLRLSNSKINEAAWQPEKVLAANRETMQRNIRLFSKAIHELKRELQR